MLRPFTDYFDSRRWLGWEETRSNQIKAWHQRMKMLTVDLSHVSSVEYQIWVRTIVTTNCWKRRVICLRSSCNDISVFIPHLFFLSFNIISYLSNSSLISNHILHMMLISSHCYPYYFDIFSIPFINFI